ncbi:MAG TPA: copper chaperone PCu(A)C [Aliidongia sp.]|uniref:copper chaperone PCu(A)C n=1 Tax=Aliidongia sp. TaxID=1914230 RepID=UPI002DDD35E6|nr:copper chaperone PCu(A)C [Aliidongia sp.]HEV2673490.1 copper chaperone PCu(A)C [Aliidongia sp.]
MQFRRFPFSALAAVIAVGAAILAQQTQSAAQSPAAAPVQVTQAWARATPGKSTIGAAYATVTAPAGDRLVAAATPVAGAAQLHEHTMDGGIMKMRQVDAVPLPAGQAVTLSPGGYHIMLMDLKAPLVAGQSFPLTLTFEKAGAVETTVTVGGVGASGPAGASGSMAPMNMGTMAGHKG